MSRALLVESGFTLGEVASVCDVSEYSARKYLYGERALSVAARSVFLREYGARGRVLVGALDARRAAWESTHELAPGGRKRVAIMKAGPKRRVVRERRVRDAVNPAAADYSPLEPHYTISEWKERFGSPGDALPDANGRVCGFFASEPCFCE